ncbi:LysM peptidoglycan-binding domain-containing protein [Brevibacillus laterosporus]|uniref:LysM peptidoglycan-binding domain-containing protein n=1 Tax=Brevibacillus laterosporus TaxID=1465 RepID=A0AAP3DCM3_BRELA|nr:LysM peptidoglycan-binding domain-containing protein [Brevibacillus laterosporus]MCR8978768.1 LysM peptidoglycan-binding domain-containing protein [Brevibacillus laterosporus]MCZ0805924.1 LysM peptidoglycan-binding domain-containing protein [Brevibacillus laterosporus]
MSVQDGLLSFQMKETIFLSSDKPEIEELRELELLPDLEIRENDYEITICGSLQLRGKYVPTKNANAKANGGTDTLVSAMKFTPLQLEQGDTEVFFADEEADIMHRIPLSISVPISRTKEVSDIHGIVDSFDYEIKGPKQLLITADLKIAGIQLKNEQEIRAEQQSHKSADTWEYIQVAQDESAEHEYQHVTIDDLERKLTALEKEVEAQLEQQNDEGQELIDEVADTEQYQPYPLYQPFPGFEMQQGDVAQSSWDQDSATRFRYQHPQYAAYEAEAEEEAEREEIEEIEQSSNVPYQTYSNIQEESMGQQSPYEYGFHPISMPEPPQYAPPYGTQPFYPINSFGQGPGHGFGVEPNPIPFAPPPPNPFQPIAGQFHHQQPPQYPFAQMPPYAPPQQMFYQPPPYPPNPVPEPVSAMQYQPEYMAESPYQATYQPPPSNEYVEESVEDQEVRTDGVYAEPVSYHEPAEVEDDDEAALEEEVHESPYEATFKEESSHIEQSEPFTLISEHQEEATEPKEAVVNHQEVVTEPKEAVINHQEIVTEPKEAVANHQEVVTEPKEVAVNHQEVVTEPKEAVVKHQEVVTEPKEAVVNHQEVVTEPKEAVVKHQEVVTEPKEVAVNHQEVVTEPKEAVVKHQEVVTEPKEAVVNHQEVVTEPKEAAIKHQEVDTEPKEVAVKHQEVVTEPKEAVIKHQEETTAPKEAVVKHQEETTEPKEAVVKQQEMATEPKEVVTEQREEWIANPHSQSKVQLSADPDPYAKYWESEDDQEDITKTAKKEATTERATEASKVHVDLDENRVHAHTAEYDQELQAPAISTELSTEEEASVLMAQLEAEEEKSVEEIVASPVVEQEKEMKVAIGSKNNHKEQNEMMNFSNIFSHLHGNEKNKNQRVESKQEEALEQTKAKRDGSSSRRDALGNLTSFVQDRTEKFSKLKMCIIQKNDTLDSIAQRYDLSVTKIKEANRMSTDRVEEGQILYIPQ